MAHRKTPAPRYQPPKVGDYIARKEFAAAADGSVGGYVALKIGRPMDRGLVSDEKRMAACETLEGAELLAKLLNDTRDLAARWRTIRRTPLYKNGNPEHWARTIIASTVCKALEINAAHDFGASMLGLPVIGAHRVDVWDEGAAAWHARDVRLDSLGDDVDARDISQRIESFGFAQVGGGSAPLFKITKAAASAPQ